MMSKIKNVMKNFYKDINAFIILVMLTSIIMLGVTTCLVNIPINYSIQDLNEVKNFIVNKRTLKIHKVDCSAVKKMSEKNKQNVNDTIVNLTNSGYVICNRCRAGIKRQNEFAANILDEVDSLLFGEDIVDLPTKEEYLKSIEKMGNWYVNNIPTYQKVLKEEKLEEYIGELKNVKKYKLKEIAKKDSKSNEYKVITKDKAINIENFSKKESILMAKEEAVINYSQNYNKIETVGRIACYPCDYIKDAEGGYDFAGDDCVRFMFSCFNNMDKRFVNLLSKYSKIKWSNIDTKKLAKSNMDVPYAMQKLGFEIYDIEAKTADLNNDGYYEFLIKKIDTNFKLEKGDIIVRHGEEEGHVHFYLSDNENFGWGKVNREYPQKSSTYLDKNTNKILCNGEEFTRVYRYIGNNDD